jgi:GDP-4-dehydro-6-deoxy-D-mannose reductase
MNYLVTGITGFAGPHLARLLLDEGHEVYGLIRGSNGRETDLLDVMTEAELKRIRWLVADLVDFPSLEQVIRQNALDGIFHLAAQSHPPTSFSQPVMTFQNNVMGSVNLIEAVAQHQPHCKLHFCSSSEVYGNQQDCEWTEDAPIKPANPYGATKAAIDIFMQERLRNQYIRGFITRAHCHTGPRRGYRFSISSDAYQIAKMILDLQEPVLLIGNLDTTRQVMDVRDCVRAYYRLMQADLKHHVYNVSTDHSYAMRFFTETLIKLSGLKDVVQKIHPPFWRPIDIQAQHSRTERLRSEIDWKPEIPIEQTLGDLLAYWVVKLRKSK